MTDKEPKSILERIERLENAVFSTIPKSGGSISTEQKFVGVTGGIKFLIKEGFFSKGKLLSEVRSELILRDYHYSLQAVQTALGRLSKISGPLVTFKENSKKVYAKRK